jgi:hypothetical protein
MVSDTLVLAGALPHNKRAESEVLLPGHYGDFNVILV